MAIWNTIQLSDIHPDRCDAEFFRKDYQDNLNLLENTGETITLGKLFKYINRGTQPQYNKKGTLKALRSVNVGFMNFNETRQEYVTEDFFAINTRGKVQKDDVLITSTGVGTLGRTSIWFKDEQAFCDGHITILRNGKVDPYFVTAFLNSIYGLKQYDQNFRGSSGQIEIYPYDISKFVIPECLFPHQVEIGNYLREAFELQTQSQTLYKKATDLLEQELGLNNISYEKPKSYRASFSEITNAMRSDAEFFNVKFIPLLELVKNYKNSYRILRNISVRILPNFIKNSSYESKIDYVEIGDINVSNGFFEFNSIYTKDAPANAKIKLSGGEILISMVRPTRGAIAIVPDILTDSSFIASGAFYVFKMKDLYKREIVWLYFRLIKELFEKYCGGSSYPTIDSRYIASFPIPNFDDELSKKVSSLITESKKSSERSKNLLADAKAKIEQLIEEAANK